MIVQRLATGAAALPKARKGEARAGRGAERNAMPAIAGREQLLTFVRRSVLLQLMLAMALIAFAALIYLNQASKESVLQFSIADLQRERIQLDMQNANLFASASRLQSLSRVYSLASSQLHMSPSRQNNQIWINPVYLRVPALPPDQPASSASLQSQPLAWMQHAVQFIAAQL
jgi:cell division protein FtsL